MQIEIETVDDGVGVASLPLSEAVTFDGVAFVALAVRTVADIAADAATLAMTPTDQRAYTTRIDSKVTASTRGIHLSARAHLPCHTRAWCPHLSDGALDNDPSAGMTGIGLQQARYERDYAIINDARTPSSGMKAAGCASSSADSDFIFPVLENKLTCQ